MLILFQSLLFSNVSHELRFVAGFFFGGVLLTMP